MAGADHFAMILPSIIAYLPYFEQPRIHVGPVTIAAFGIIVAASVMVGLTVGSRRFHTLGLDVALGDALA